MLDSWMSRLSAAALLTALGVPAALATTVTCKGPTTRQFTLSKGNSGWTVTGMSGEAP